MEVKNINGTSDNTCKCGSWLKHWKNFSQQSVPRYCPAEECVQKPEMGAHVQKDKANDPRWYIVPLCKKHDGETGNSITIIDYVKLVSANVSETCGR